MYVLLEFLQKKGGETYYEPTIMVHDSLISNRLKPLNVQW